jgi:SAM-dependent methyltransferase
MPIVAMRDVPALLGTSHRATQDDDKFLNFNVLACTDCGMIQTDAVFDPAWYEGIHSHGIGKIWDDHRRALAALIDETFVVNGDSVIRVLEVGPSVNPIVRGLCEQDRHYEIDYVDLMPDPPFRLLEHESYIQSQFPSGLATDHYDIIIASHVIEHTRDIGSFIGAMASALRENGVAVISTPNFNRWIGGKFWNAITSEHIAYPFAGHISSVAERVGLKTGTHLFQQHSFFAVLSRVTIAAAPKDTPGYSVSKNMLQVWASELSGSVDRYERAASSEDRPVLLAGASHLSQYPFLMSTKLRSKVVGVLDNASDKHGERLYGTPLVVREFKYVREFEAPIVIIPLSPYVEEMKAQVAELNPEATIIS